MTITQPRTSLTRLLTASALSLALLGGITACAPASSPTMPPGGNNGPSATAAPTTKAPIDPNVPDSLGSLHGYITKVISSRVVEYTPSAAQWRDDLTGKESSFLVLMGDSEPDPGTTCDEARAVEVLNTPTIAGGPLEYKDTANGQLNAQGQRQGNLFALGEVNSLGSKMKYLSCFTTR